jgi:non-homologous end joining protein Ku
MRTENTRVKNFMTALDVITNCFDDDNVREAAEAMACEHRSLQQRTMNLFLQFVTNMAESYDHDSYDLRNEFACQTAVKIRAAFGGELPQMPFI